MDALSGMRSYRSLAAWQRAHSMAKRILSLTGSSGSPSTWALYDQLRRASISVEANIVEGYALGTPGLFKRHVRIAFGSTAEVECLLGLAVETKLMNPGDITDVREDLNALFPILRGLLRSPRPIGTFSHET